MSWSPLQSDPLDCYVSSGDRLTCAYDDMAGAVGGEVVFGLLLGIAIFYPLYAISDSIEVPAAALILLGAFLVPILPGGVAAIAPSIVIVGLAVGIFAVLRRYSLAGVQ